MNKKLGNLLKKPLGGDSRNRAFFENTSPPGASAAESFLLCSTQIRCLMRRRISLNPMCLFHLSDTRRPEISLTPLQPSEPVPRRAVVFGRGHVSGAGVIEGKTEKIGKQRPEAMFKAIAEKRMSVNAYSVSYLADDIR